MTNFAAREAMDNQPKLPLEQARLAGLRYYYSGKHCVQGHLALRLTASGQCVECNRLRKRSDHHNRKIRSARIIDPSVGQYICGVPAKRQEIVTLEETGVLSFRIIMQSGLANPAGEEMANFNIREGNQNGRLIWGIYNRESGQCVASFLPGNSKVVSTLRDVYNAWARTRRYERISFEQLRRVQARRGMHVPEVRMAG